MIGDILSKQRHEIGVHGWIHEQLLHLDDEAEEQRLLNQSIDYLTEAMGKRPVGFRAPSWAFSRFTMQQIKAAGFLYDSSLMASDDAYEILLDQQPTGVIELPIEWILDDHPFFGALANGSLPSPELVLQILSIGVRSSVRRRRSIHLDDAPSRHRTPLADRGVGAVDRAHEVQVRRLVRHPRSGGQLRESARRFRAELTMTMLKAAHALTRLRDGNQRFASNRSIATFFSDPARRAELISGQEPFAVILGCSDSRVPAELIFDQGFGDLFVIRVAGHRRPIPGWQCRVCSDALRYPTRGRIGSHPVWSRHRHPG